jgi:hypothetical protein
MALTIVSKPPEVVTLPVVGESVQQTVTLPWDPDTGVSVALLSEQTKEDWGVQKPLPIDPQTENIPTTTQPESEAPAPAQPPRKSGLTFLPPAEKPYTIMTALGELGTVKRKGQTLMLVQKKTGLAYRVMAYDEQTHLCVYKTPDGGKGRAIVGEREVPQYDPLWR